MASKLICLGHYRASPILGAIMFISQGLVSGQESLVFLPDYWAVVQSKHNIGQEEFESMYHKIEVSTWITVQGRQPDGPYTHV